MTLPFAKPPARIVVDKDKHDYMIAELLLWRSEVDRIIGLLESGRTMSAKEALAALLARLS